jgi:hypothetical protein
MVFEIIAITLLASDIASRWYIHLKKPVSTITPLSYVAGVPKAANSTVETLVVKDTTWIESEIKGFESHLAGIGRTATADAQRLINRLRSVK